MRRSFALLNLVGKLPIQMASSVQCDRPEERRNKCRITFAQFQRRILW